MTTWHAVQGGTGSHGARWTEYRAVEFPRLTRMVQRVSDQDDYIETYHVDGLTNYWHDEAAAVTAMRANPCF